MSCTGLSPTNNGLFRLHHQLTQGSLEERPVRLAPALLSRDDDALHQFFEVMPAKHGADRGGVREGVRDAAEAVTGVVKLRHRLVRAWRDNQPAYFGSEEWGRQDSAADPRRICSPNLRQASASHSYGGRSRRSELSAA